MNRLLIESVFSLVPVLLLLTLPTVTVADVPGASIDQRELGRLFMSPADRIRIDSRRASGVDEDTSVQPDRPQEISNQVVLNGWVKRGNGENTVWLNGEVVRPAEKANGDVIVLRGPAVDNSVVIGRSNGKRVAVKPGQAWNLLDNTVEECGDCSADNAPAAPNQADSQADPAAAEM